MANYYDEILQEIQDLIDHKQYQEAFVLLKREKSMPYIPRDIEVKLDRMIKDIRYLMSDKKSNTEVDIDTLLEALRGNSQEQLLACNELSKKNLRDCTAEIKEYLSDDPFTEAAAILVESIAEQEIQEEFTWNKDHVEYTFYGDSITPCAKSKGFLQALKLLESWFSKNPDMFEMSKTLLIHEVFVFLPLSYDEDDAESLAYDIAEQICLMMNANAVLIEIQDKMHYHPLERS